MPNDFIRIMIVNFVFKLVPSYDVEGCNVRNVLYNVLQVHLTHLQNAVAAEELLRNEN